MILGCKSLESCPALCCGGGDWGVLEAGPRGWL